MEKNDITFADFIKDVSPAYHAFVTDMHDYLLQNGCAVKFQPAKNGCVVSYTHVKNKRVLVNYVFRKSGLVMRIYGDHISKRADMLEALPDAMVKAIQKAPACKRMFDPAACNSRCAMGYDFVLRDGRQQKCRYSCFMFEINEENIPHITSLVSHEMSARGAA